MWTAFLYDLYKTNANIVDIVLNPEEGNWKNQFSYYTQENLLRKQLSNVTDAESIWILNKGFTVNDVGQVQHDVLIRKAALEATGAVKRGFIHR